MKKKILGMIMTILLLAGVTSLQTQATEAGSTGNTMNLSQLITDPTVDEVWEWGNGREIAAGTVITNDTLVDLEIIYVTESVNALPTGVSPQILAPGAGKTLAATEGTVTTAGQWKVCGNRKGGTYGNPSVNVKNAIVLCPAVTFSAKNATYGYTQGEASVSVNVSVATGYTYTYQWYSNTTKSNSGGTVVSGANQATYQLPAGKSAGDYYYYCVITASGNGKNIVQTGEAIQVTVEKKEIGLTWTNTEVTYNGTQQVPVATATGLLGTDTCTVTVSGGQTNASAAGTSYTATATALSNTNYKLPANNTTAFTIKKATMKVAVSYEEVTGGYKLVVTVTEPATGATVKFGETEGSYTLDNSPLVPFSQTKTIYYQVTETSNNYETLKDAKKLTVSGDGKPTGEIEVGDETYETFIETGKMTSTYFDDEQEVTISADDSGSGVDEIYYYQSESAMSLAQVQALASSKWKVYSDTFTLKESADKKYIIYVKITDLTGNVAYISTNTLVLDGTAPSISGVKEGGKYCQSVTVTVTDTNLSEVTLDSSSKTISGGKSTFTITGDGKQHTITATDKSGNETEYTFTMYTNHDFGDFEQTQSDGIHSTEVSKCKYGCGKSYKRVRNYTEIREEHDPSGGSILTKVNVGTGAPGTSITGLDTTLAKSLIGSDAATQASKGVEVLMYLDVTRPSSVATADKTSTENAVKQYKTQNLKEGMYLDLSLYTKKGSSTATKITKDGLGKTLKISFTLPEALKAPAGTTRSYYVVRVHNGSATVLNTTLADNKITFETDRFSTYSIWYTESGTAISANSTTAVAGATTTATATDNSKDSVPKTGDEDSSIWYGLLCLVGAIGTIYFGRKKFLK